MPWDESLIIMEIMDKVRRDNGLGFSEAVETTEYVHLFGSESLKKEMVAWNGPYDFLENILIIMCSYHWNKFQPHGELFHLFYVNTQLYEVNKYSMALG